MTHHNMSVFFSGTDMKCLHDNAPHYKMFLSVIVNAKGDCIAKIAIETKVEMKFSISQLKSFFSFNSKPVETYLGIINCKVEVEGQDEAFATVKAIKTAKERERKKQEEEELKKREIKNPSPKLLQAEYTTSKQLGIFKDIEYDFRDGVNVKDMIINSLCPFKEKDITTIPLAVGYVINEAAVSPKTSKAIAERVHDDFMNDLFSIPDRVNDEKTFKEAVSLLHPYRKHAIIKEWIDLIEEEIRTYNLDLDEF